MLQNRMQQISTEFLRLFYFKIVNLNVYDYST